MSASSLLLVANAGEGSISTFRLIDGALERLAVTPGLAGCSTFAVDPDRGLVYAGVKGETSDEPAGIVTLALDRATGALSRRSRLDLPRGGMNYLSLTHGGTGLLGAAYSGGYGITCLIDDGVVSAPVSHIEYPNLHAVLPSSDGAFAYFVSLGADLVAQYALGDDLSLTPLEPPTVAAPTGSGPRHLLLSESQDAVYVLTEYSGELLAYARDTRSGTLEATTAAGAVDPSKGLGHSSFGADPLENHFIWGADLHWGATDADGIRRIWCSERTESTLGAVTVHPDGSLADAERFFVTETQPRGFDISADGAHLVAAGERSRSVALYRVDQDRLELVQRIETGEGANWVRFV